MNERTGPMAPIAERVAEYIREQGKESNQAYHVDQVASALGLTRTQVVSARSDCTRLYDDIFPCSPNYMVYEPGWKEKHPEVWAIAQSRSISASKGRRKAIAQDREYSARRKSSGMPNVIGPVTTILNVVAVNVHADHVSIQHEDGSFTELTGAVKLREKTR